MERGLYKYAVIVLCAVVGVGCYFVIPWSSMNKSDWAAWVQAIQPLNDQHRAVWHLAILDRLQEHAQRTLPYMALVVC
ncbi:hypothetical protein [Burkholderia cenocepacia]|uniref:hypothetical protein n=1 Tax=Burkholderia cenocepacia TaxID=95486 RepID=UPI0015E819E3|nr:hypothetical protein [Burkholderia cenocepacia]MDN7545057.1 hypothetical protein [Burkholderia cenocepacia]